jgi:hypothetical protein
MGGRQPLSVIVEHKADQRAWNAGSGLIAMLEAVIGDPSLNLLPNLLFHDRSMQARMRGAFADDHADVDRVLEDQVEVATRDPVTADLLPAYVIRR